MEREREREIEWGEKTTKWIAKIKKKMWNSNVESLKLLWREKGKV